MALQLPRAFALKLSYNNKYLAYIKEDTEVHGLLKYSADDLNELTVFEVEAAKCGNGLVNLRCSYNNKYWRRWSVNHWWIAAQADEPEEDESKWSCTLFKPTFVDGDSKTLRLIHVQLGHYVCAWRNDEPYRLCLFAAGKNPDNDGLDIFSVTDMVPVSSEILDVKFRLEDAKIQSQTTVDLATGVAVNNDEHSNESKVVTLEYTLDQSSTWKVINSWNSDLITNIKSAIPVLVNGKTQLSGDELTGPYQWGKALEKTGKEKTTYSVIVPPCTMVSATLKATKATADIPFSYTQRNTFANGIEFTRYFDDGTFTRTNLFDFKYEAKQQKRQVA